MKKFFLIAGMMASTNFGLSKDFTCQDYVDTLPVSGYTSNCIDTSVLHVQQERVPIKAYRYVGNEVYFEIRQTCRAPCSNRTLHINTVFPYYRHYGANLTESARRESYWRKEGNNLNCKNHNDNTACVIDTPEF